MWDKPPAPLGAPIPCPATILDDDLDADSSRMKMITRRRHPQEKKGGRKKLMWPPCLRARSEGGGLAYVYKTSGGAGDGYPRYFRR